MDRPISIIVPAFNQLVYCKQCVASILMNTHRPYRLILVDNGSTDGVGEYFDGIAGAHVVHAESNRGFAGGVNLGLAQADGHIVVLNSDTIVPDGWLARLERALDQSRDIGMVGPVSNYVCSDQLIEGLTFQSMDEINAFAQDLAHRNAGKIRYTKRLIGFCFMIRDTAYEKVGLFDESFGVGNFEDDDYCYRVSQAGYCLCIADDCFVFHYGNRTFMGMGITGDRWDALLSENKDRFFAKWDIRPAQRHETIQHAKKLNQEARRALEEGNGPEALRILAEAVEVCPLLELNYNDLGVVLWQMDERELAYNLFARAVWLNPSYKEGRENLREAAAALGKTEEADQLLEEN